MPIQYQQTTDTEIQDRVRQKRWTAIEELEKLHFKEYSFFGETVQALGFSNMGLAGFLGTLVALPFEVIKVDKNLDVTAFNAVLASREDATYAAPFGLWVKFYTSFTDGTCVISANFDTPIINDEKEKLYKSATRQTITSAWLNHKTWVDRLCQEGKQRVEHLSFAGFLQLTQREDEYLLKHKNSFIRSDLASTILSGIVSISFLMAFVFIFMLLPTIAHYLYPACWFVRNMNKPSLLESILIIAGCFIVSWLFARVQKTPLLVDGVGTKFFGQSPSAESAGYISTKWLVFLFIPILPVKSYLILEDHFNKPGTPRPIINPLEKLNWIQVKETMWKWKFGYVTLIILVCSLGIWSFWECI
jgi:hypothetical protein